MKIILALFVLTLSGCAMTSGYSTGPDGRPVHYIDGMSAGTTYAKAHELCPSGYTIVGTPQQTTLLDYTMTIECK